MITFSRCYKIWIFLFFYHVIFENLIFPGIKHFQSIENFQNISKYIFQYLKFTIHVIILGTQNINFSYLFFIINVVFTFNVNSLIISFSDQICPTLLSQTKKYSRKLILKACTTVFFMLCFCILLVFDVCSCLSECHRGNNV